MSDWLKTNQHCPSCGSKRGLGVKETHEYCFSCGYYKSRKNSLVQALESKITPKIEWNKELPLCEWGGLRLEPNAYNWLKQYLDDDFIDHTRRIFWGVDIKACVFPVYRHNGDLAAYQIRNFNKEPKWRIISPKYAWGYKYPWFSVFNNPSKTWVIVEDIISALKVSQVHPSICLFGSSINNNLRDFLLEHGDKFIIWLDGDKAGQEGTIKLLQQFSLCAKLKSIRTKNDPKFYSLTRIGELIGEVT